MISRNTVRKVAEERKEKENRPASLPAVSSYTGLNITFAAGRNNRFQLAFSFEFHILKI